MPSAGRFSTLLLSPSSGTLFAPNAADDTSFTVAGNWERSNPGVFDHNSGTLVLDGAGTVTITDSTIFFNLTSTAAGKTFQFDNTATQIVEGALTLTGTSGNLIVLRSDTDGQQWGLNNSGTNDVSYVDVQDSDASAGGGNEIDATTGGVNSGNNLNWTFPVVDSGVSAAVKLQASETLSYMSHSDESEDEKRKRKRLYIQITALIDTSNLILRNPYDFSISPYIIASDI